MTQEDKQLLLQDLCARASYGIYVLADVHRTFDGGIIGKVIEVNIESELVYMAGVLTPFFIDEIRPYLRSMSSMTEEERKIYYSLCSKERERSDFGEHTAVIYYHDTIDSIDYLTSIHVDYRNLISKSLAIEVTEESNPYK